MDDSRPIFVQLAQWIADGIAAGDYPEGTQVPSTTELSAFYRINPATAAKALHQLADRGLLERRRGLGMFTVVGARERILAERRAEFHDQHLAPLATEARAIGITEQQLLDAVRDAYRAAAATAAPTPARASAGTTLNTDAPRTTTNTQGEQR